MPIPEWLHLGDHSQCSNFEDIPCSRSGKIQKADALDWTEVAGSFLLFRIDQSILSTSFFIPSFQYEHRDGVRRMNCKASMPRF